MVITESSKGRTFGLTVTSSVAQTKESLKQYSGTSTFTINIFPLPIWFKLRIPGVVVSLIASPIQIFAENNLAKNNPLDCSVIELLHQHREFISIVILWPGCSTNCNVCTSSPDIIWSILKLDVRTEKAGDLSIIWGNERTHDLKNEYINALGFLSTNSANHKTCEGINFLRNPLSIDFLKCFMLHFN